MPAFEGIEGIVIQPLDEMTYTFGFSVSSSATANDGSIPYGTTISSVAVTAHQAEDGTDVSDEVIVSSSVSNNVVSVKFQYDSDVGELLIHLRIAVTLSDTDVKEYDFNRVTLRNL